MARYRALELRQQHSLQPVRFIHDQHVELGQQALSFARECEQRVIHDQNLRLGSLTPRPHPVALAPAPAGEQGTRRRIGADPGAHAAQPFGIAGREPIEIALDVARGPAPQRVDHLDLVGGRPLLHLERARAQVVLLALEPGTAQARRAEGLEQGGQIPLEQLILKRPGAGCDHDPCVAVERMQYRRRQVGERLADSGRSLREQRPAALDGVRDRDRKRRLFRARLPVGPARGEHAPSGEGCGGSVGERHGAPVRR